MDVSYLVNKQAFKSKPFVFFDPIYNAKLECINLFMFQRELDANFDNICEFTQVAIVYLFLEPSLQKNWRRAYRNLRVTCDHLRVVCPQVIATSPLCSQMSQICHTSTVNNSKHCSQVIRKSLAGVSQISRKSKYMPTKYIIYFWPLI